MARVCSECKKILDDVSNDEDVFVLRILLASRRKGVVPKTKTIRKDFCQVCAEEVSNKIINQTLIGE